MTKSNINYLLYFVIGCLLIDSPLAAQVENAAQANNSAAADHWNRRQQLEAKFFDDFESIIAECRQTGLQSTADHLQRFLIPRDPQRQYIFLPTENQVDRDGLPAELPVELKQKTVSILKEHANKIFELAKVEAANENSNTALQLLNETLFFQPNHKQARKTLGHRVIGDDGDDKVWRVKADRLRIKRATKPNNDFRWPAKTYFVASTNNFQIVSNASEKQTELLAQRLERWHDVWRQVFFMYYNSPKNLNRWIAGDSKPPISTRKHKVVFFSNKNDYVAGLENSIPGVEASTGFYNDSQKTSFFFASDDPSIHDTWRHELTHQMFQESRRSVHAPFQNEFLWLGEGIAMYFESLIDCGDYVTLGGFDSRRLQFARLRRLKEQFRVPIAELSGMDQTQFQSSNELSKVYSQAAGITHYLMDADFGAMRQPLIEFLKLSYQGRLKPGTFEKIVGKTFDEIDQQYDEFLKVKPEQLKHLAEPESRTELALIGLRMENESLAGLNQCRNLRWIDLSGCDVHGDRLQFLTSCTSLKQLFLTGAVIDTKAATIISQLSVSEVDLSGSNLTDEHLEQLANSKTLSTLNVTGTKVTSAGIKSFSSIRPGVEVGSNGTRRD